MVDLLNVHFLLLQFLINGESSPVHQLNTDFELPQNSLLPSPSHIKTEATLTPVQCNVKQEKIPIQSCGVKSIQPMPVTTVPVSIKKPQIGQLNTKPAGGMYIVKGITCDMIGQFDFIVNKLLWLIKMYTSYLYIIYSLSMYNFLEIL